jgi:hypothetical protein
MDKLQFAKQAAQKIKNLCNAPDLDERTADTYEAMADVVLGQCAEISSTYSPSNSQFYFLNGQINAMDTLRRSAVLDVDHSHDRPVRFAAYQAVDAAWEELYRNIDRYPLPGQENKKVPTTLRSPLGSMDPSAFDD